MVNGSSPAANRSSAHLYLATHRSSRARIARSSRCWAAVQPLAWAKGGLGLVVWGFMPLDGRVRLLTLGVAIEVTPELSWLGTDARCDWHRSRSIQDCP